MKDIIISALAFAALYKTIKYKANWEYHALLWIAILCALGYRVFPNANTMFHVHPMDLLLLVVAFKFANNSLKIKLPIILQILFIFCFLALIITIVSFEQNFAYGLHESKSFMLIFPCFMLAAYYIKRQNDMLKFNFYYVMSMLVVSILGIIEFYFPSFTGLFLGIYQETVATELWELSGSQFFERAKFTNWGAPTAGHIIVLAIPLTWTLKDTRFFKTKILYYFVLISLILAVYIAGARSDWIILLIFAILYFLLFSMVTLSFNRFITSVIGGIVGLIILFNIISSIAITRFLTGLVAIQGEADIAIDSSGYLRKMRLNEAWENVLNNPFGVGWGHSGWVHADFVQFTANLGWIPGILFVALYVSIMIKGFIVLRKIQGSDSKILAGFWIANISSGFQFATNGIYSLSQTAVPFFILLGLQHYFTQHLIKKQDIRVRKRYNSITETNAEADVKPLLNV